MIPARDPVFKLVAVMRAARMSRLALGIDGVQHRRVDAQIGDESVAGTGGSRPVGSATRVANGRHIAANRAATVIEQLRQIAAR